MKTSIAVFFLFSFSFQLVIAQECSTYFPFEEGVVMGYAYYGKKGELDSRGVNKVTLVDEVGEGELEAQIESKVTDSEGKLLTEGHYKVKCKDNVFYIDVTSIMSPQMTESFSHLEVTMTGDALQIPSSLEVGQTLPDASNEIKAGTNGINFLNMTFDVIDRKVEALETVTTPAGSFECFKISHTMIMKMMIKKSFKVVEWYAAGVGIVKSETYNKKDKLESWMELERFEKS